MKIDDKYSMYDPLMYVLMFPHGDKGWDLGSFSSSNKQNKKRTAFSSIPNISLIPRGGSTFNVVHRMGGLFQQYIVDMYTKTECDRLQYVRHNQARLCAELYQGLANAIQTADGNVDGLQIWKKVILPSNFTAGSRYPTSVVSRCNAYSLVLWQT